MSGTEATGNMLCRTEQRAICYAELNNGQSWKEQAASCDKVAKLIKHVFGKLDIKMAGGGAGITGIK